MKNTIFLIRNYAFIILITNAINSNAQVWQGSAIGTITTDNVTIGSSTGSSYTKLSIHSGFGYSNCSYTGNSAIKIKWQAPIAMPFCNNGISGSIPDIFYTYSPGFFWNNYQPSTIMRLNGEGNFSLGGDAKCYFGATFYGRSYFGSDLQVKNKLRINNGNIAITDWSSNNFPFSFSVDQGDSRFMGNVELEGDLIIKGNNNNTTGVNEIKLSSDGYIRAREIKVDYDNIPDYVFKSDYKLLPLLELEKFINLNNHLPNIKSENEFDKIEGLKLGELNLKLLEKIEELTLYTIQLQKQTNALQAQINLLKTNSTK
jgi:hypothetical protein